MITETGRVIALQGDQAWVQTIRQSACGSCSARQGCGQRVLASASGGRANQVLVANSLGARVGDEVTVAIAESALLSASLLVYALPLLLFVAGALVGHRLVPGSDAGALTGALLGLGAGFLGSRLLNVRIGDKGAPELVRILPTPLRSGNPTDL